ncbi:MAG TPA: hypothetical protein VEK33_07270 [Terriglobales bacterium]|nr:hypothetical protein [Terriglobales bacterium]
MAASQVVLYFARQEDALLFTLAASSAMSADGAVPQEAGLKMAEGISKATRITTEGELSATRSGSERVRKANPTRAAAK